jgi:hypothetical protein
MHSEYKKLNRFTSKIFSDQEIHQVFSKTQGLCYTCLNQIDKQYYMSNHSHSWFIVNKSNHIIFGQKIQNPDNLQPICENCLDNMNKDRN